jgi:hypothetical protein
MIRHLARAGILVLICIATVAESAPRNAPKSIPRGNQYDGAWTVLIVTEHGSCDRAYRYGIQIIDGMVHYDGSIIVSFDGRVAANGKVQVSVAAAGNRANGSGRLSRDFGQGKWQGSSGSDACAGYWEAERR